MTKKVNKAELVALLGRIKYRTKDDGTTQKAGMRRVKVVSVSDPALRKGDKGRLVKTTTGNVDFNRDMRKLREKAGLPATGGPLPWGQWVAPDSPVIEHKGRHYFACIPTTEESAGAAGMVCKAEFKMTDGTPLERDDELVQSIVYRKKDGTPLAQKNREDDYGFRVFSLDKASMIVTIDDETFEYHPE